MTDDNQPTFRLMTAQQVADHFGIPSYRTLRTMRANGLPAVRLGKAYLFDPADVAAFIEAAKKRREPEHPGRLPGPLAPAAESASVKRARATAQRLIAMGRKKPK